MMKENKKTLLKDIHVDLIIKNRSFIQELSRVQELYYDTLKNELGLSDRAENLLYDYVFNENDENLSFTEYLARFDDFPIYKKQK